MCRSILDHTLSMNVIHDHPINILMEKKKIAKSIEGITKGGKMLHGCTNELK